MVSLVAPLLNTHCAKLMFWNKLRLTAKGHFDKFLSRAIPRTRNLVLNHKKLFILPTKSGWFFVLAALLIWLLGTNYENNLALALAYFLLALFLVSIIHTFRNLHRLTVAFVNSNPIYQDQYTDVTLQLSSGAKARLGVTLGWQDDVNTIDLAKNEITAIVVRLRSLKRGLYRPPRMLVESTYPLGLWRCWSLVDIDIAVLTYPKPIQHARLINNLATDSAGDLIPKSGGDEFHSLKDYQVGDSLKHIAWKQHAQGRGLYSKHYQDYCNKNIDLNWDLLPGIEPELRLSSLCYLAIKAEKEGEEYELTIPGVSIAPGSGTQHLQQVLRALALFSPAPTLPSRSTEK